MGVVDWGRRVSGEYTRTRASLAAGGLAYFVALSLAPAALAFGSIAGIFLDPTQVRDVLERMAGRAPETASAMQPFIDALVSTIETASASAFTITTVVSALVAIYAASKVVYSLRMAMNDVFRVQETRSGPFERAISAIATLVGMIAAVALVIVLTIVPRVLQWVGIESVRLSTGNSVLDWVAAFALAFLLVRWTIMHSPNVRQRVPWTSLGAWVATVGIAGATVGVGIYAKYSSSLGATVLLFGTAVVILLWLYLTFVALLWGAIIEADSGRAARALNDDQDGQLEATTRTSAADQQPAQ
jgi:membrane protein